MPKQISSFFVFLFIWANILPLSAQKVTLDAAKGKAALFFSKSNSTNSTAKKAPRKAPQLALANNRDEFYVFNDDANGGYVVISGDERMPEVLGYSYDGHFDANSVPCNMQAWLEDYAAQMNYLRTHPEAKVKRRTASEREDISPLLTCLFRQSEPYNKKCPVVDGEQCPTGCVATAMAQVMYYYQWPKQTTDIIPGYTTETLNIEMPAIPITTIDWDNMLKYYSFKETYPEEQINAISTLMMLCGTSIEMNYTPNGSGAGGCDKALRKYFGYDELLEGVFRDAYDLDTWEEMIYDELRNGRPVIYSGFAEYGGHAFVMDGYRNGYFHVNWGTNMYYPGTDNYFLLTDVGGWNNHQDAFVGVQPAKPNTPSPYAVLDNEKKITLYYDNEKDSRTGTIIHHKDDLPNYAEEIVECVIDPSFANIQPRRLNSFFGGWSKLKSIKGLENLNTSRTMDIGLMFAGCSSLADIDLTGFKTNNVRIMKGLFGGCTSLTSLDLSCLKTDNVTDMSSMFYRCTGLTSLNLSCLKTDNVTDMGSMFNECSNLISLDLNNLNTNNVTNMSSIFLGCTNLTNLDLNGFKTYNVNNMTYMFKDCSSLKSLNLKSFKTDNMTRMFEMFGGCSGLTSLDLSSFKTDNVTDMTQLFRFCSNLSTVYVSDDWNTEKVQYDNNMFKGCKNLVGGAGTSYNSKHLGIDYAHVDGGPDNPGYFTYKENTKVTLPTFTNVESGDVYSLSGVRLRSAAKGTDGLKPGIYIMGGKKIVLK